MIPIAVIILLPMLLSGILLVGAVTLNEKHTPLKIFLFMFSIIPFFISMHMGMLTIVHYYDFPEMQDLIGSTTYWVGITFGVLIAYFIIYFIYIAFRTAAQEKQARLQY